VRLDALRDALGAVLPEAGETNLLRACLWSGEAGRSAWHAFARDAGDLRELFRADRGSRKRLGPLLAAALRTNAIGADPAFLTVLRTASLREELRAGIYAEILADVLAALDSIEAPVLVLTGAAFGWSLYPSPALRHSHDIDLLLREGDVPRAAEVLVSRGFKRTGPTQVEHGRALPVNLQVRFLPGSDEQCAFDAARSRSRMTTLAGRPARVLAPGDSLFQVLGLAALTPSYRNLQWACDAWLVARHMTDRDWEVFQAQVARSRLALWCWIRLEYLIDGLGADVPEPVRMALRERAAAADGLERDHALYAARAGSAAGLRQVLRGASVAARIRLLLWLLFPSSAYLRAAFVGSRRQGWPALYLRRGLRWLSARSRRATAPMPGL
jgi:hypothetical protein